MVRDKGLTDRNSADSIRKIGNASDQQLNSTSGSYLVKVNEAASITGLPASLIRKSFMMEDKRQPNIPPPPPHKRIGRAVYIVRDSLAAWVASIDQIDSNVSGRRRRRPTVTERIERRRQSVDLWFDDNGRN